jgi:hypothetical protein
MTGASPSAPPPARASERPRAPEPSKSEGDKPVLASELLVDEVAPLEPARSACRVWLILMAAGWAAVGLVLELGAGVPEQRLDAATVSFGTAAVVAALALLPLPYRARATLVLAAGGLLMSLGLRGLGPLGGLVVDGGEGRDLVRLMALAVLPAALGVRARYPTYRPSRWLLVAVAACAAPFLALELLLCVNPAVDPLIGIVSALSVGVVGSSLAGLSSDRLTRGGPAWAWAILLLLPAGIALRELTPLGGEDTGLWTYPLTAFAMFLAGLKTSLGAYQLLADWVAPKARASARLARHGPESARLNVVKG